MATPKIIADFETQLATAIAAGDTSFTLASATDDDGVALPTGLYYFTVNNGSSNKEYLAGTLTGSSVASVVNVSRQGVETSGANNAHRVGDSVILTDFNTYKKYIDETTVAGSADASTSVKGVVEAATLAEVRAGTGTGGTGAVLAVTPDVLDDLPSEDEKLALVGAGATPDTNNKFLTEGDIDDNTIFIPPTVETFTSSGTWTKDSGLKYVVVETQGGGGNGGAFSGSDVGGGGGSAGGYVRELIPAASLGATETVTVGTAGNNSSFGSHHTAGGGNTGSTNAADPSSGGTATGGDLNIVGGQGERGSTSDSLGGTGGDSPIGGSGGYGGSGDDTGGSGGGYGAGGGGASQAGASGGGSGGAGATGIVIVTEYYS